VGKITAFPNDFCDEGNKHPGLLLFNSFLILSLNMLSGSPGNAPGY
jgi:hypothetical protein